MVQVRRALLLLACLPAGCAQGAAGAGDGGPVTWWHQLQGGAIARERPPPPNSDAPYPKLVSVPARPAALPAAERSRIASTLRQDRANAEYAAASVPIVPPAPVRTQAAPPPDPNGSNAVMQAADAPPPPAARPVARPVVVASATPALVTGMPLHPPPPPVLPGVPALTRPSPAPVAPPEAARRPAIVPGQPVAVAFALGSAALPPGIEAALGRLAATRGAAPMRVAGFGAAAGAEPPAQAAALPLAFARAEAIANALARAGVPLAEIRLSAAAQGQGGVAAVAN